MKVKIIMYDFLKEEQDDTLNARMVKKRLDDLQAEFENNHIPTEIDRR